MKLKYEETGKGTPVLLIHAFPLSNGMWKDQVEILVENDFRVILPDLPGFGENTDLPLFSIEEMASMVGELLDSLNIEKAVIGGLSMGGYVSLNLFRINPQLFAGLILCDTTYASDTGEKRKSRFDLIEKIEREGSEALIADMLFNLVSVNTKHNNESLIEQLKTEFSQVVPRSAINALRSMAERKDHTETIKAIDVPTLLIFGEDDKVTNLETARQMHQTIPDSKLVVLKNAGHYSNLEQPAEFNRSLLGFCNLIKNQCSL